MSPLGILAEVAGDEGTFCLSKTQTNMFLLALGLD
jgi:hypothetical protein